MGNRRPKSEQLDKRLSRKAGFTLSEILVTMAVLVVVLAIISILTSSIFSVTAQTQALMEIDEQISNIQTRLKRILSHSYTSLATQEDINKPTISDTEIELVSSVPLLESKDGVFSIEMNTRLWYDEQEKAIYYEFPVAQGEDGYINHTQLIAEHVEECFFRGEGQFVYYEILFRFRGIEKPLKGVVRIY